VLSIRIEGIGADPAVHAIENHSYLQTIFIQMELFYNKPTFKTSPAS
jgi:hypothetical protein